MPMANGLYVKVYLLGYRQACDPNSNPKFDNNSIAKNLNIPLSDVIDAWKFWQNKNIIRIHFNMQRYHLVIIYEKDSVSLLNLLSLLFFSKLLLHQV